MQKIILTNPCNVSPEKLSPVSGGHWCGDCRKTVIDYSDMSDGEMLSYISKHGLGCGEFRPDQLDRELQPTKTKKKLNLFYYLPLLFVFLFKPPAAKAQCRPRPDTVQVANPILVFGGARLGQMHEIIDSINLAEKPKTKRLGGAGVVCVIRQYKQYSLFWGLIKFKTRKRK